MIVWNIKCHLFIKSALIICVKAIHVNDRIGYLNCFEMLYWRSSAELICILEAADRKSPLFVVDAPVHVIDVVVQVPAPRAGSADLRR